MLLKISKEIDIDAIKINFDSSELWLLNIAEGKKGKSHISLD